MARPVVTPTGTWVDWINGVLAAPQTQGRSRMDPPGNQWAQLKKVNTGTFSVPVANAPDTMRMMPALVLVGTWAMDDTNTRPVETWI